MKSHKQSYILGIMLTFIIIIAVILASVTAKSGSPLKGNKEYANGIDISAHNGEIDWQTVAENTEFAIIRAGYRGYGAEGKLSEDKYFKQNMEGAVKAGLPVGVYFYTQAVTAQEAEEEAQFVAALLKGYNLELPVFIDFEYPNDADGSPIGRMHNARLTKKQATENILVFCEYMQKAGYKAGVYSSSHLYTLQLLANDFDRDICIWVADYNSSMKYAGRYDIWQYSKNGACPGVNSKYCDVNRWYAK